MTRWCSAFSMKTRRLDSSSVSLNTGMPVAWASTSAIRPSSTTAWLATSPERHCFSRRRRSASGGLVDQVDGLVGQEAVADVAVGEVRRRDDRAVGDLHLVVRLVAVAQALQDVDGVRKARLGDLDRLEAALERGILLEVLAVLVERGRADRLQLAAGEERLQ